MADKYTDTIAASNVITDDAAVADAVAAILADHLEETAMPMSTRKFSTLSTSRR